MVLAVGKATPAVARSQACVLSKTLTITSKPKSQSRKTKLNPGASVEVLSHNNGWVQLRSGTLEGYAQVQPLRRSCHASTTGHQTDMLADLPIEPIVGTPAATAPTGTTPAATAALAANATPAASGPSAPSDAAAPAPPPAETAPMAINTAPAPAPAVASPTPVATAASEPAPPPPAPMAPVAPTPDPPEQVSVQIPTPNHHLAYAATLWTVAGVGLVGAGGMFGYNTLRANALEHDINAYNAQSVRSQATNASLQQRVLQVKAMDTWTIIAAGAGAACAAGAIYFTWFADDSGSTSTSDASSSASDRRHVGINILPGGIAIFGSF